MAFLEGIRNSGDFGPIMIAGAVILIIVGLTIMAMGFVVGYVVFGVGVILIVAKILGLF
ncbi:MAG: hypothetical protein V3R82_04400 [Candidatus Hydrothermarchaeales archaeon]